MDNVWRLIYAKFFSSLYFAVPLQTLFLFAKGLSFTEIMLLESVLLAGILLFEIPTGVLGDRIGRKWSLVLGSAVSLLSWIPWFLAQDMYLFGASFFLSGVAIAFQSGADQALLYDDLKSRNQETHMQKVIGRYFGAATLATALAALFGGYSAINHDISSFYFLYKCTFIAQAIGLLLLITLREPVRSVAGKETEHAPEEGMALFRSGMKLLMSHTVLRKIALLSIFTIPFSFVLVYIFQPYFAVSNVPHEWYGIAVSIASFATLGVQITAHRLEKLLGVEKAVLLVTVLPALFWGIMAFAFHPAFAVILYILNVSSGHLRDPIFSDYLNRHIPSNNRATVLSTISLMGSMYALVVRPIIGYVADSSLQGSFLLMAGLIMLGSFLFRLMAVPRSE